MHDGPCLRQNQTMASIVNMAQSMQRVVGREAAYQYLARHAVPVEIIVRALSSTGQKRARGEPPAPA